ncbi:MAG: GHKL domain-containing protein [Blautia faecis]
MYLWFLTKRKSDFHIYLDQRKSAPYSDTELYGKRENKLFRRASCDYKNAHDGHGYGLKSVRKCVEKYNGSMDITAENHMFSPTIIIPVAK